MALARRKATCSISTADTTTVGVGWPKGMRELVCQAFQYWLDDALVDPDFLLTDIKAAAGVSRRIGVHVTPSHLAECLAQQKRMADMAVRVNDRPKYPARPIREDVDMEKIIAW